MRLTDSPVGVFWWSYNEHILEATFRWILPLNVNEVCVAIFWQFDIFKAASLFFSGDSNHMSRVIIAKPWPSCLNSSAQRDAKQRLIWLITSLCPPASCSTGCWITWATLPRRPACRTSSRRAKPKSASSLTTGAPTAPTEVTLLNPCTFFSSPPAIQRGYCRASLTQSKPRLLCSETQQGGLVPAQRSHCWAPALSLLPNMVLVISAWWTGPFCNLGPFYDHSSYKRSRNTLPKLLRSFSIPVAEYRADPTSHIKPGHGRILSSDLLPSVYNWRT